VENFCSVILADIARNFALPSTAKSEANRQVWQAETPCWEPLSDTTLQCRLVYTQGYGQPIQFVLYFWIVPIGGLDLWKFESIHRFVA